MICRLLTWPARAAWGFVDEGIWLARAAIEVASYGVSISGPPADEPDWAHMPGLSNEHMDAHLEGDQ